MCHPEVNAILATVFVKTAEIEGKYGAPFTLQSVRSFVAKKLANAMPTFWYFS